MHPNEQLVEAGKIWAFSLIKLIRRKSKEEIKDIYNQVEAEGSKELMSWVEELKKPKNDRMGAEAQMGWGKIAWTYGFRYLR